MVFCSAKNFDKLFLRQDALEKQLSMEAKLCFLEINLENNTGYGHKTTLPVTRKEQESRNPVLTQTVLSEKSQNTIPSSRHGTGRTSISK